MLTDGESACARQLRIQEDGLAQDQQVQGQNSAAKDVLSAEATAIFHADLTETRAAVTTAKIRIIQEIPHVNIADILIQETEIIGTIETTEMTEAEEILEDAKAVAMEETETAALKIATDADALKAVKDAVFLTEEVSAEEAAKQETTNIDFVA